MQKPVTAAAGWGGDTYVVYQNQSDDSILFATKDGHGFGSGYCTILEHSSEIWEIALE